MKNNQIYILLVIFLLFAFGCDKEEDNELASHLTFAVFGQMGEVKRQGL